MTSTNRLSLTLLSLALAALAACSEKTASTKTTVSDSAMASMNMGPTSPDKADSSSIAFSAGQIQHGGIKWGPAQTGTFASPVVVPGTIVPNENLTARIGAPAEGRVVGVRVQPGDRV